MDLKKKSRRLESLAELKERNLDEKLPKPLVHKDYQKVEDCKDSENILDELDASSINQKLQTVLFDVISLPFDNSEEFVRFFDDGNQNKMAVEILDRAPSPFCLPRSKQTDDDTAETVKLVLKETETVFILEIPQLVVDLNTPEGQAVKEDNERYESILAGFRRTLDSETQTEIIYTKTKSTFIPRQKRFNKSTFVNNWIIYDTFNELDNSAALGHDRQDCEKLPKLSDMQQVSSPSAELDLIYKKPTFMNAVKIMERIIISKIYLEAQKKFKGLIKPDLCNLNWKFTYDLNVLWTHSHPETLEREVTSVCWNYKNPNLLAAAYGSRVNDKSMNGLVIIWSMKNPCYPERIYRFNSPVSSIDWSRMNDNQLAVGFHDGNVKIIDVLSCELLVIKKSSHENNPIYWAHRQIKWWRIDNDFPNEENIYTCNENGSIYCYKNDVNFEAKEIMKVSRIEGSIPGIDRTNYNKIYDVAIKKNPSATLLKQHPVIDDIYLIASDEGCVYQCSIDYLNHYANCFSAHDGPINTLEYSPFSCKIFLTCGADWCVRIWIDEIFEPLITLSMDMSIIQAAAWSPNNSTIIATCHDNKICIWDIKWRVYQPSSITTLDTTNNIILLQFTDNGNQLVAADDNGSIYIVHLENMPFAPYDQKSTLFQAIEKNLVTKPELLRKVRKTFI